MYYIIQVLKYFKMIFGKIAYIVNETKFVCLKIKGHNTYFG